MKYFIDTNIIIDLLRKDNDTVEKIIEIVSDNESELYINKLVAIESLRTIHFEHTKIFQEAKLILDMFEHLEINPQIYDKSIDFSRYCHSKGVKLKGKCEAINFLHFITAKHYNLTIISNDKDFEKLEQIYIKFEKEAKI